MSDSIRHLVEEAVKSAMRERNKEKTSTLRMALSELKKEEIDRREEITNEDSIKILQRMIKQRKESKTQFLDAGRSELANKENEEILRRNYRLMQLEEVDISTSAKTKILDQMSKEHVQWMLSKVPRGRFLELNELSSMVCWLSSEENSFSTAAVFDISGGRSTY